MSEIFEVGVYTASAEVYANEVVRNLDPNRKYIRFILSRKDCVEIKDGVYVKDLNIIMNRNPKHIFLIDNYAHSYINQVDNGIPIVPYYDNFKDDELLKLQMYLRHLSKQANAFEFNKNYFKSSHIMESQDLETLEQRLSQMLPV